LKKKSYFVKNSKGKIMLMKKIVRKFKLPHLLAFKNILVTEGLVLKKDV
jgi:hypothetical protein